MAERWCVLEVPGSNSGQMLKGGGGTWTAAWFRRFRESTATPLLFCWEANLFGEKVSTYFRILPPKSQNTAPCLTWHQAHTVTIFCPHIEKFLILGKGKFSRLRSRLGSGHLVWDSGELPESQQADAASSSNSLLITQASVSHSQSQQTNDICTLKCTTIPSRKLACTWTGSNCRRVFLYWNFVIFIFDVGSYYLPQ